MAKDGYSREIALVNEHGLHLRPASRFVALANRFRAEVYVSVNGGDEGNGKSILDLSARAAARGSTFRIRTLGVDAEAALEALVELVASGFDELSGNGS
jgi:phosphocarrier protein